METCSWCKAPGKKIADSYGPTVIMHCTACHHEWHTVPTKHDCERCGTLTTDPELLDDGFGMIACEPCREISNARPDPTDAKDSYD